MKRIIYLITIHLLFTAGISQAQQEITVNIVAKKMSRGEQPGFQVNIPQAKQKDVMNAYEKQLEQNSRASAKEISGELTSYGVVNKALTDKPFIVYSRFLETTEGVVLTIFVSEDSLTFIGENSEPDKINAVKKALHDFAVNEYRKVVNARFEGEKKKLASMNDDLEDMISDENSNMKGISSRQREIENDKIKLEQNKAAQASKSEQVANQQKMIDNIGDKESPEHTLASKNLKNYQGEKRSLEKDAEKTGRNIDNNNAEIRELEHKNEELKRLQAEMKTKIDEQTKYIGTIEKELNGIR